MDRSKMHIGQQVKLPAREIITWDSPNEWTFIKKVKKQKERILFVRELHNPKLAGLSYTMDTPPERSMGILYEYIEPLN